MSHDSAVSRAFEGSLEEREREMWTDKEEDAVGKREIED